MKKLILNLLLCVATWEVSAQSFNADKVAFTNFLVRMYENAPFEGVRVVVDDNDSSFLISVLMLDKAKYPSESTLHRVASVKAISQASRYFNGSSIAMDMIIRTSERSDGSKDSEIIEDIREHSLGYVKSLEHLTNFTRSDNTEVFIFMTPLQKKKNE